MTGKQRGQLVCIRTVDRSIALDRVDRNTRQIASIPKVAVVPIFVLWFGSGSVPAILTALSICFFPIVVASVAGFKSVDPDVMDFARSTGASPQRMFFKIRLPQALPGLRARPAL